MLIMGPPHYQINLGWVNIIARPLSNFGTKANIWLWCLTHYAYYWIPHYQINLAWVKIIAQCLSNFGTKRAYLCLSYIVHRHVHVLHTSMHMFGLQNLVWTSPHVHMPTGALCLCLHDMLGQINKIKRSRLYLMKPCLRVTVKHAIFYLSQQ